MAKSKKKWHFVLFVQFLDFLSKFDQIFDKGAKVKGQNTVFDALKKSQ